MERATLVFVLVFLALPVLALLAVALVPGLGLWLALLALVVLALGFTVALGWLPS